jgi:hypothetical protein
MKCGKWMEEDVREAERKALVVLPNAALFPHPCLQIFSQRACLFENRYRIIFKYSGALQERIQAKGANIIMVEYDSGVESDFACVYNRFKSKMKVSQDTRCMSKVKEQEMNDSEQSWCGHLT